MDRLEFKVSALPDRRALTIEVRKNGAPVETVLATVLEAETLIRTLSNVRQQLVPEVSRHLQPGQEVTGPSDPIWQIPTPPGAPGKLLAIRHPGIGWLAFFFPAAEATKLGNSLLSGQSPETINPPSSSGRPNRAFAGRGNKAKGAAR